ncbi:MAG: helix-turn-helix domain-containing protein [Spiribacter salinus]|uniref:Helix-turn-helix domain-containing protein n=1 Tax=Spiribacter salinus TaxID=1335746 RepID=A0A540VK63_9GAMM|nr:MAG: helix-turn-helix domain-containing protein [Spiribacter salinus]
MTPYLEEVLDKSDDEPISAEVPKRLRPALGLEQIEKHTGERNRAIADAYSTGAYTLTEIARYFGIHLSTASRIARGMVNARDTT